MICDKCGSHRMQGHSTCKRTVRDIEGTVDIMVRRLRCEDCGRTQAVPQAIAPKNKRFTFAFIAAVLDMVDSGISIEKTAYAMGISPTIAQAWVREDRDG